MNPLASIQLFILAVLVVLGTTAYFVVTGMAGQLATQGKRISELERLVDQKDAKLLAEAGRIERRDRAISLSKCADTINDWIRHPEKLPEPFDPFRQFGGHQ